jgi:hypothetical protein
MEKEDGEDNMYECIIPVYGISERHADMRHGLIQLYLISWRALGAEAELRAPITLACRSDIRKFTPCTYSAP